MALKIEVPYGATLLVRKTEIRKALRECARLVMNEAKALTGNPDGGGRAYSTPSTMLKGVHYASAPGQPPALLSGGLHGSFKTKAGKNGDSISVLDTEYYAKFLETGAKGGGGNSQGGRGLRNPRARKGQPQPKPSTIRVLEPRPFLSRALTDQSSEIERKIIDAVTLEMVKK